MNEATIILANMRGGCATVGKKVHVLFRLNHRRSSNRTDDVAVPVAPERLSVAGEVVVFL